MDIDPRLVQAEEDWREALRSGRLQLPPSYRMSSIHRASGQLTIVLDGRAQSVAQDAEAIAAWAAENTSVTVGIWIDPNPPRAILADGP